MKQEIHITVKENKTIAVLKEDGKVTNKKVAICNSADTFSFETGAKLALGRLFIKKVREVERQAKVGEHIKLIGKKYTFNKLGDVLKVYHVGYNLVHVLEKDHPHKNGYSDMYVWGYDDFHYVVLENYEPPKEKTLFLEEGWNKTNLGKLGTETKIKDIDGTVLKIGDQVDLYNSNLERRRTHAVVKDSEKCFVMGIKADCDLDGKISGWYVRKSTSYKELNVGDRVDGCVVVEKEI